MKAKLITALLVVGISLQAAAMGHPHNLFAAHKHVKAKHTAMNQPFKTDSGCSKITTYAKNTVLTSATIWSWFAKEQAK
jgi:hypothetical protein